MDNWIMDIWERLQDGGIIAKTYLAVDREMMVKGRRFWMDGGIRAMGEVREWLVELWRGK